MPLSSIVLHRPLLKASLLKMLILPTVVTTACIMTACDKPHKDPLKQTIPTNSERWETDLAPVMEKLSEEDQQILSRYMLRMKMSNAYEAGAVPNISIGDAIKQQRAFEANNSNNANDTNTPTATSDYVLSLSPVSQAEINALKNGETNSVSLRFLLSNRSRHTLTGFSGDIAVLGADFSEPKRFTVDAVTFEPPILPEQAGKITINTPITDINVMRAIKDPASTTIVIHNGTLTLDTGETVKVMNSLDK